MLYSPDMLDHLTGRDGAMLTGQVDPLTKDGPTAPGSDRPLFAFIPISVSGS